MTRVLLAWVPVRGTFWSGMSGGCVTHWRIDGEPMSTVSVRARVALDENMWLPGEPSENPPKALLRVPSVDDGMALKEQIDLFVNERSGGPRRVISVQIGKTKIEDAGMPEPGFTERSFFRDRLSLVSSRGFHDFQLAPPRKRGLPIEEGEMIGWDIDGTEGPKGPLDFTVGALVHFRDETATLVEMSADSVYVDVERHEMELVFRGIFIDPSWGAFVERILLGVLPRGIEEEKQAELLEEGLSRAAFAFAATNEDIEAAVAPPPLSEEEQTMARLSSLDNGPGAPQLSVVEFARVSQELGSGARATVLSSYGFDEVSWGMEEWAQAEHAANASANLPDDLDGDDAAESPNVVPTATREKVGKVLDIAEYARLSAHLSVRDPGRVLAEAKISPLEFVGIEEEMNERVENDEALAAELERLLPTYREDAEVALAADLEKLGIDPASEDDS